VKKDGSNQGKKTEGGKKKKKTKCTLNLTLNDDVNFVFFNFPETQQQT
jgi:hypothetical protein